MDPYKLKGLTVREALDILDGDDEYNFDSEPEDDQSADIFLDSPDTEYWTDEDKEGVIMWKTLTRGFRETFERGLSFGCNSNSRVHNESQRTKYCQYYARSACFLVSYRNRQGCKEGSQGHEEGTREEQRSYHTYDAFDSWLGAVSCSSALALGWVLSQPCNWKRWLREQNPPKSWKPEGCKSLVGVLARVAVAQPPLPPTPADSLQELSEDGVSYGPITAQEIWLCPGSPRQFTGMSGKKELVLYRKVVPPPQSGYLPLHNHSQAPLHPLSALNEAADNFFRVHNSIFGDVENKKAIALIEGPNTDKKRAIQLFFSASKKGFLPAAYNLGQCYELGIGTKQDFHEAAKWYQKAADGGHPRATYNLAVFHAHGWGGLAADRGKTKKLLESAAALGLPDAAEALGITKEDVPPPPLPLYNVPKEELIAKESQVPPLQDISSDPNELYRLASTFENSPCEDVTQPYLVLQLYKMASELGHKEAKSKYQILHSYDTVGLLTEYLCRGGKPTSDCSNLKFSNLF